MVGLKESILPKGHLFYDGLNVVILNIHKMLWGSMFWHHGSNEVSKCCFMFL